MKIAELYEMPEKTVINRVNTLPLPESDDERQISILAADAKADLVNHPEGLCVPRFNANFVLDGVDVGALKAGMRLKVGEAELVITKVRKRCYDHCEIRKQGRFCPLPTNTAFARVIKAGQASVDAPIEVIK
ncbi:MAG: hypothetical protein IJP30_02860 [Clostridia bacterium]|nr:hypothetical protein [Clostridia bacterium]